MNVRRLFAACAAIALLTPALSSCNAVNSGFVPGSSYGTLESSRMTPQLHSMLLTQLRRKIKHVFVIFQENHSFDNYFGTFPGAENLGTPLAKAHGYSQYDMIAKKTQTVFRIANPDILGPDQDRYVLEKKFAHGKMNDFLSGEEAANLGYKYSPKLSRQYGLTTMAVYDCDTVPYLWMYAKNFALLDHYFQSETGPSSPGNVAMIAAQAGISQEHHFPKEATNSSEGPGVPMNGDLDPFEGPYTGADSTVQLAQSYATLAMTLGGPAAAKDAQAKPGDVAKDLATIAGTTSPAIDWAWDQEGYVNSKGAKAETGYVAHHNAPQYFDYLRENYAYWSHVGTTEDALTQIKNGTLPDSGVFFIKGSKDNHFGWKPANKSASIQSGYLGDDDHPGSGNSDHEVAEAFVATYVNAIAASKYWKDSAILITWDDGGGFFDHVAPANFEKCNDGFPCGDGQRVPFILISPYSLSGAVITDYSDTASVAKFVEATFGVRSMASLPDEADVAPYGPRDGLNAISDLAGAFDLSKLDGTAALNAPSMAEVPSGQVGIFPPKMNCASLGITPIAIPTQPPYYKPNSLSPALMPSVETRPDAND